MILLTGSAGLNGRAIAQKFARQKQPVRAPVRSLVKAHETELGKLAEVDLVEADMSAPATLEAALEGIDRLLMISSSSPSPEALTMDDIAARLSPVVAKVARYIRVSPEERRKHPKSRVGLKTHEIFGVESTTFSEFVQCYAFVFRDSHSHQRNI